MHPPARQLSVGSIEPSAIQAEEDSSKRSRAVHPRDALYLQSALCQSGMTPSGVGCGRGIYGGSRQRWVLPLLAHAARRSERAGGEYELSRRRMLSYAPNKPAQAHSYAIYRKSKTARVQPLATTCACPPGRPPDGPESYREGDGDDIRKAV
jgi:hypothetical protein